MIVTVAVVRPNSFVASSVYVVVCVGVTEILVPRIAPTCGVTMKYEAPATFQFKVTGVPAATVDELAEKLPIDGALPVGRFACV